MVEEIEEYKEMFLSEAKENLEKLNAALLKLEKHPTDKNSIEEIFRNAHSLKSSAATMKYDKMSKLCHTIEDVFDEIKSKKRKLTPDTTETVFKSFDNLGLSLKQISEGKEEADSDDLISKLKRILEKPGAKPEEKVNEKATEGIELAEKPEAVEKLNEVKVKVKTLDVLMNLIEELLVNKMKLDQLHSSKDYEEMEGTLNALGRLVADLQYNITQARMVPVEQIFTRFPRMVRDLAKKEGKEVELIIEGGDIELDRTIIDKLGEPLVHLLRNAVDHGIETPEIREERKKEKTGKIKISAKREKGYVIIDVEDDGNGILEEKIKQKAIEKRIISKEAAANLKHDDIVKLLTDSRFSTAEKVTEISGRGVGLNVVITMIDSLGGELSMDYQPEKGMKVSLKLPLTLAIIKALLTQVGEEIYAIPASNIVESVRVKPESIKQMMNQEMAIVNEQSIPLIRLEKLFNIPKVRKIEKEIPEQEGDSEEPGVETEEPSLDDEPVERIEGKTTEKQLLEKPSEESSKESVLMVIVSKGGQHFGLGVDSLIADQDIVIKPLDKITRQSKGFAGFTILGDGRAVLILDTNNLI